MNERRAANLSPLIECARESAVLLPLHDILAALLAKNGLQNIADLEFRAVCSLAEMEISGIYLDCDQAKKMAASKEAINKENELIKKDKFLSRFFIKYYSFKCFSKDGFSLKKYDEIKKIKLN